MPDHRLGYITRSMHHMPASRSVTITPRAPEKRRAKGGAVVIDPVRYAKSGSNAAGYVVIDAARFIRSRRGR